MCRFFISTLEIKCPASSLQTDLSSDSIVFHVFISDSGSPKTEAKAAVKAAAEAWRAFTGTDAS